ncbi:MAG: T9SS type A sorting domain-containing protein [Candidatus Marinimicrobia bacterium]|nr:T9SS type A sorting domain-containing protein [Candidatus Neomarinimicrobiota bacterium]
MHLRLLTRGQLVADGKMSQMGFYYISYECMKRIVSWVYFYENLVKYEPKILAIFNITHGKRGECSIGFLLGDTSTSDIWKDISEIDGGDWPFPSNDIVIDITDFFPYLSDGPDKFYLGILDAGSSETGILNSFTVEIYKDYFSGDMLEELVSRDKHISTVNGSRIWVEAKEVEVSFLLDSTDATFGDTIELPVEIRFGDYVEVNSIELMLSGYQEGLEFIKVGVDSTLVGELGWSYVVHEDNGRLKIQISGARFLYGNGSLINLLFYVFGEPCSFVPVNFDSISVEASSGVIVNYSNCGIYIEPLPRFGDVDMNKVIQAYDASLILKYVVGYIDLSCQSMANADVSQDGTVSALDASLILQYNVGEIDTLPYSFPQLAMGSYTVSIGNPMAVSEREIEIPLNFHGSKNVFAFEMEIVLESGDLEFKGVVQNETLGNFIMMDNVSGRSIKIAGACPGFSRDGGLSTVTLRFIVDSNSKSNDARIVIRKLRINEAPVRGNAKEFVFRSETCTGGSQGSLPCEFGLSQNYPNPFNPFTTICYQLPEGCFVELLIYDLRGNFVERLVSEYQEAGYYEVEWDATDVSSGIYLYKLSTPNYTAIRKAVVMK